VDPDRRRRRRSGPSRLDHRHAPARQAQAELHPAHGHGRQRHRHQRRQGAGDRQQADKPNYWHTGYPGGIKSRTTGQILEGDHPERVVTQAVKRMLPGNR
jgi:hypothetical protein